MIDVAPIVNRYGVYLKHAITRKEQIKYIKSHQVANDNLVFLEYTINATRHVNKKTIIEVKGNEYCKIIPTSNNRAIIIVNDKYLL